MRSLHSFLFVLTLTVLALFWTSTSSRAQQPTPLEALPWQHGPVSAEIGDIARVSIPEGYLFLPQSSVARFNELTENLPNPNDCGVILSRTNNETWFAVFSFSEEGYVKDDEGRSLDADRLLRELRENQDEANKQLRERNWATMTLDGWSTSPFYNPSGHHLEWGLRLTTSEPAGTTSKLVNHNVKLLGRDGVMTCNVVGSPEVIPSAVEEVRTILNSYSFNPGRRYEEYRNGDKVAAVGLTGLILGGAAVAAAKSGLWAKLLKPILVGIGALFLGLIRRIGGLFKGRSNDDSNPSA